MPDTFFFIAAFALYFIALITIGVIFTPRTTGSTSFSLGNRSINYWVTAIATQASDMGGWLFLGLPAMIYQYGLPECWTAIGLIVGMWCTWQFIAPQLRILSEKNQSSTLPAFLASSFGAPDDRALRITGSCLIILFSTFYIASGLVGLSLIFQGAFGIPYHIGIVISMLTAALYTLIGGFTSVAWCDFFQGIFLLAIIIIVPLLGFMALPNGWHTIAQTAQLTSTPITFVSSGRNALHAIMLALGWGLGYLGQPHILMNFMGIDDPKNIAAAKRVGITWQIFVLSSSVCIGLVGIGWYGATLTCRETLFVHLTTTLFHPFFAGLALCAVLAATLSTIDSLILASGVCIAQDILNLATPTPLSQRALVTASRIGALFVSFLSLGIAWDNTQTIYHLVNYAWSGLGSAFGPLVIGALYFKGIRTHGALAAMIIGGLVSALWPYGLPLVPGFISGLITLLITSRL